MSKKIRPSNLLDIKDSPLGVRGVLVLCCVTDKTFLIGKGDVRRSDTVSLVVDHDFDFSAFHHTNATVTS